MATKAAAARQGRSDRGDKTKLNQLATVLNISSVHCSAVQLCLGDMNKPLGLCACDFSHSSCVRFEEQALTDAEKPYNALRYF